MATITGTSGTDTPEGTSGSDKINTGSGNDILYYSLSMNSLPGTNDIYTGGSGIDMVVLQFTRDQWFYKNDQGEFTNQMQLTRYFEWKSSVKTNSVGEISNGLSSDFTFTFGTSTLKIQMMEQLGVMVDDQWLGAGAFSVYSRLAPTANADAVSMSEDAVAPVIIDVLNGAGGADTVPDLVRDLSMVGAGPAHGTVELIDSAANPAHWTFQYTVDNAYYQYLAQDVNATDSFQYQVTDVNGKTATATVTVTITGADDKAEISGGAANVFSATEDALVNTAQGKMTVADADAGQSYFVSQTLAEGTYGTFSIDVDGNYSYSLDNTRTVVQSLRGTDNKTESFTIWSQDESTSTTLEFKVQGTNDAAEIDDPTNTQLTEDKNPDANNMLVASGTISITDKDTDEAKFIASSEEKIGSLNLQADGSYTYTVDNTDVQYLGTGKELTEVFTVTSLDGTSRDISFVTTGVNDTASISFAAGSQLNLTEDDATQLKDGYLEAKGILTISDADLGEATLSVDSAASSTLGTFSLDKISDGRYAYTYRVNNLLGDIQDLNSDSYSLKPSFTVVSADGLTTEKMVFEINGVDDNESPVARNDVLWVTNNTTATFSSHVLLANDTDADSSASQLQIKSISAVGTSTFLPSLSPDKTSFTFDTNALRTGTLNKFSYVLVDEKNLESTGEVIVNVVSLANIEGNELDLSVRAYAGAYLVGNTTFDTITAGAGDSVIVGRADQNFLTGGSGNDILYGWTGFDDLNGGYGDDSLYGRSGDDDLNGWNGNDSLYGGEGNDFLEGMHGSDKFFGGSGADKFVLFSDGCVDTIFDFSTAEGDKIGIYRNDFTDFVKVAFDQKADFTLFCDKTTGEIFYGEDQIGLIGSGVDLLNLTEQSFVLI